MKAHLKILTVLLFCSMISSLSLFSQHGTNTASYHNSQGDESIYTLYTTRNFSSGQLCNWQYFSEINVDNSGNTDTLTDYSVLVYVNTAQLISDGKVNANGSDIRFTTNFSDDLEYWIEPGIQNEHGMNDDSTHIWVKIPVIPASETLTLYMFYGNPTATAKSNISTTFLFGDDFDDNSADLTKWDLFTSNSGQIIEQNQRIEHNSPTSSPESNSAIFSKQAFTGSVVVEMQFKKGGYVYRGAGMMDSYGTNQYSAWIGWQDWGAFGPGVTLAAVPQSIMFRNDAWSRQYNPEYYLKIFRKPDSTFQFIAQIPPFEDNGYKYWTHTFSTAKMPLDQPLKVGATEHVWVSAWPLWTRYEDNIRVRKYSEPEPVCNIISELETTIPDSIVYDTICSNDSLLWRSQYYSTAGTYYDSLYSQVGCDSVFVLQLYVHPVPVVSVNNDTICSGFSAILTATGATTYEWSTGSTDNPYYPTPAISTVYTVTGTDGNLCSNTAQATVIVNTFPVTPDEMIPTKITEIIPDANTIVLDHLNNSSTGDVHGALTFVESVCGLNYAGNFDDGEWIHYGYNANLRDAATVDMWIYPTAYSTPLVNFNWSNVSSYPGSGHVFHLDLNAAGHIIMSNWPGTGLGALETNSVVPLNQWTHVAVSWGDSTVMYLNGNVDNASAGSFRPSASGPYHIYIPKWGTANDLLIDEFHVSNKRRSQTEIRQGYQYIGIYAEDDSICANTSANIVISNPQSGISYQLLNEPSLTPVGSPQTGDCADLTFNTGDLNSSSLFRILADNPITGCGIIFDTIISITVLPVFEFPTFAETCDNVPYVWRGNTYDLTGVYYDSLVTQYGCDSVFVLNLTVHPTYEFVSNAEICDNQMYNWRGNNYNTAGTYYDSLTSQYGCDSVYVLNLTVNPAYEFLTYDTICDGDIYIWRGNNYTIAGQFYDSFMTAQGCDSVYVLNLFVNSLPVISTTSDTICFGENATLTASGAATYEWNTGSTDNPYTVSPGLTTVYTVTGTDGNMCTNTAQATVIVYPLPVDLPDLMPTKVTEITADANTIVLDHLNNSSSGDVHGALTFVESVCGLNYAGNFDDSEWIHYAYNANLRDAATVDMWIYPTAYSTPLVNFNWSNVSSPPGSGHVFHLDLNAAGHIIMSNWPGTGLGALETNSVVPLNQWTHVAVSWGDSTVMYLNGNVDNASAGSFRPSASGPYHIYIPKWGAPNDLLIDEFHVSNKRRSQTEIRQGYQYIGIYAEDDSICANTSANIVISNPESGISYQLLNEPSLTPVGTPQTGDCADLIFNTGDLTSSSLFTIEAINPATGCGIVLDTTILITVLPVFEFPSFAETCDNVPYVWRGNTYDLTGVYYDSLVTQYGCDSIFVLNLTVHPTYEFVSNAEICDNQMYNWRGNNYNITGSYYDSLTSQYGCDSVYVLNLTVNPTYESVLDVQICDNENYFWRGNNYSVAGTYYDSLQSLHGCDSVFVLNLSVNPTYEFNEHMDLCWGDNIWWHGNNYNDEGVYYDSLTTQHGCDSVYILTITRYFPYLFEDMITICQGDTFTWQDSTYTEEGILAYGAYYTSVHGCDSTYILYVNALPVYEFSQDEEICNRDSVYWRGDWYKFAGTYYDSLQTQSGCDSVYVLNLEVLPTYEFNEYDSICSGDTYFWRGNYYSVAGEYFDSLLTFTGCDSVYTLTLTVLDLPQVSISGLNVFYCDYDASVTMTGTPPGGTFSGQGVSGNIFAPAAAGLGTWPVSYLYADPFGCTGSDTIYVEVDECAGIDESDAGTILLYPNPTDGKFVIEFGRELHDVTVSVTDVTGKLLMTQSPETASGYEGFLNTYPVGMYYIKITAQEGMFILKLLKE